MRISINSYRIQNFFRYCLSCTCSTSPKALNPNTLKPLLPSNPLFAISSSSGFGSVNNHCSINYSSWLSSSCYKRQSLCYFSAGYPWQGFCLKQSYLQSLVSLTLLNHNSQYGFSNFGFINCGKMYRCLSVSSSNAMFISGPDVEGEAKSVKTVCSEQDILEKRSTFPRKYVLEIVDIIRNNEKDLESRLNMLASTLSIYSVTEIFEVLNSQRISGLRVFEWIWSNNPRLRKNASICSLIIDNLGRLSYHETMFEWLTKFTTENICLTYEAFGFLLTDSLLKESTEHVVDVLNRAGGSCRKSGVHALIEMFCKLDLFEMANYVIKITEHKESYYFLLLREKCRRGHIEDAYAIIQEMREAHCAPSSRMYNYVFGSLWKNGRMNEASALIDEMNKNGSAPDAITFEIVINYVCQFGSMDDVHRRLNEMVSLGLEPRLATHACIVKSLFAAKRYEEAHKYVVDSSIVYKTSSNVIYSLLANLYQEKGDIISAGNTLVEMMEKGLKPTFSTYIKIVKLLRSARMGNFARDLEKRHSEFVVKSHTRHL